MDRPNDHYKTNKDTTYHQNGQQLYQDQLSTQAGIVDHYSQQHLHLYASPEIVLEHDDTLFVNEPEQTFGNIYDGTQFVNQQDQPLGNIYNDTQFANQPDQPLGDIYDGTQFVNQQDQPLGNIYYDTQFANQPDQPLGDIYDDTQFVNQQDQPLGNIYNDTQFANQPDQPLGDIYDGTQFVNQQDQPLGNIYNDTQFANQPDQPLGDIYAGTQFVNQQDQPLGVIYDGTQFVNQQDQSVMNIYEGTQTAYQPNQLAGNIYDGTQFVNQPDQLVMNIYDGTQFVDQPNQPAGNIIYADIEFTNQPDQPLGDIHDGTPFVNQPDQPVMNIYDDTQFVDQPNQPAENIIYSDIEFAKHPDQPLVDMHDGTQFVNQPDQLVRNIYDGTQFVNHPNQLAVNIYDGTQFGSHLDQPVGNIYDGKEHGHGDEFSNQGDDEDDRDDQGFQIEDDYEMLIPEDGRHQMKKKPPCSWCPGGLCRYIGLGFYNFFNGRSDSYATLKTILGFPFGLVLAFGLYHILIEPMHLSKSTKKIIFASMTLAIASGYAISRRLRCVCCLLIPTFFGKTGRSYVGTFAIGYLIAGPINNILLNGKEITRSLSCSVELSANHTRTKWELKMKPLENVMDEFQAEGLYMNKVIMRVDKAFSPMKNEIRDEGDVEMMQEKTRKVDRLSNGKRGNRMQTINKRNKVSSKDDREKQAETRYRGKLDLQCENVWNEGVLRCRRKFTDLESRCLSAIPFIGYLLCLPMKMTFFCELVRLIPGAIGMNCDSLDVLEPGFGETYVASEDMINTMDDNFEVNLQYKLIQNKETLDMTSAQELRKGAMNEFTKRQKWVEWILAIISRLLAFSFIRVIMSSYSYHNKYLSDFAFDNVYITSYFERIDRRRTLKGKDGLFPMKKSEMSALIYPWNVKIMKAEKKKLVKGTFMLIMRMFVSGVIIYLDQLLVEVMSVIRKHSRVDFAQRGKHHVDIKVYGKGFMSNIVRMFIKSFDSKHTIDNVSTNFECLPNPVKLQVKYILYIFLFYFLVWLLMLVEAYGLRMRRVVTSFFYRKREKARILFLFNDMYKRRKGYTRHIRHEVRRQIKKRTLYKKIGLLASFRKEFPKLCDFLKFCESGKERCVICDEPESPSFVQCDTEDCPFGYCFDCWKDVRFKCYACSGEDSDDSDLTEDESESSEDDV